NDIVLSQRDHDRPMGWRDPFALIAMIMVIAISAIGWAPLAITALVGAVAMTLAGCLDADEVYDAIDWRIIILLAGRRPLGESMSQGGAAEFVVANSLGLDSGFGPLVVPAVLYLMVLLLTAFMRNADAAVLLPPLVMSTANLMGVDPTP